MRRQLYRTHLPEPLGEQLRELAEASGQSVSAVIRSCIMYTLSQPEAWLILQTGELLPGNDLRTPEQKAAWEDY